MLKSISMLNCWKFEDLVAWWICCRAKSASVWLDARLWRSCADKVVAYRGFFPLYFPEVLAKICNFALWEFVGFTMAIGDFGPFGWNCRCGYRSEVHPQVESAMIVYEKTKWGHSWDVESRSVSQEGKVRLGLVSCLWHAMIHHDGGAGEWHLRAVKAWNCQGRREKYDLLTFNTSILSWNIHDFWRNRLHSLGFS